MALPKPYYEQDGITIYHADCRDILPTLEAGSVIVSDPPYGVGFKYATYDDSCESFTKSILPIIYAIVEKYPAAFSMSMRNMRQMPESKWALCWYKPGSTRRNKVNGWSIWEPIFLYGSGWKFANDAIRLPDCTNHDKGNEHPCPKPLALFDWILSGYSKPGQIVDPFMGSGTTLLAAYLLGRRAIGIEIEERYCEIAANRLAQQVLPLEVTA